MASTAELIQEAKNMLTRKMSSAEAEMRLRLLQEDDCYADTVEATGFDPSGD
jgi:hypothetical protein